MSPVPSRPRAPRLRAYLAAHEWFSPLRWRRRAVLWVGGVVVGLAAMGLARAADAAQHLFARFVEGGGAWPLVVTPLGFAALAWATEGPLRATRGSGIPQVMAALRVADVRLRGELLSLRTALGKLALTVAALGAGASVGREGPTVQVGAALLYGLGRPFGFASPRMAGHLILAGGAAGMAAAFNTPLAGIVFAIEELGGAYEERMTGVLLTAVILAGAVSLGVLGDYTYFGRMAASLPLGRDWLAVAVTGLGCGLAGGVFARVILLTPGFGLQHLAALRARMPVRFAAGCGLGLAALAVASGMHLYGSGYAQAYDLMRGEGGEGIAYAALKFVANVLSYWSGIPGGIFSPSLAVGAGLGDALAGLFPHTAPGAIAVLAMASYLAGVTQAPLTSAVIALELTASPSMLIPILTACLLARVAAAPVCRVPLYRAFARQLIAQYEQAHHGAPVHADPRPR